VAAQPFAHHAHALPVAVPFGQQSEKAQKSDWPEVSVSELPPEPIPAGTCKHSRSGYLEIDEHGKVKDTNLTSKQVGEYVNQRLGEGYALALYPQASLRVFVIETCPVAAQPSARRAHFRTHDKVLLNDITATPGVVRTTNRKEICEGGSTKQFRNTTEKMKNEVYAAYGVDKEKALADGARPSKADAARPLYEIDHLISLELGGADDEENLWPQPYYQHPGAHEKDTVENWLHKQVCSGKMEPAEAQRAIATDWYAVYVEMKKLPGGTDGAN
jgi:hypothetical protein